jgi:hypothetical protein
MNDFGCCYWDDTYRSVLFPAPAIRFSRQCKTCAHSRKHTFSMDPQEGPPFFPFCKCVVVALQEPCCSPTMLGRPKSVVIRRRVRGRKPAFDVPSQLVTYKIPSVLATKGREKITNFSFHLLYLLTPRYLMEPDSASARNFYKQSCKVLRTFHYFPHIPHKTMDSTEGLCNSRPTLVLGQSIQPLENSFYLPLLEQKFLYELRCGTLSHGQCICNSALTGPPLLNLLGCQGKHRK